MSTQELYVRCNKCGKEAPIDQERSSALGQAYDTSTQCKCGGEWEVAPRKDEEANVVIPDLTPQEDEIEPEVLPAELDALTNMNSIVQAIIDSPSENLVQFIDIYLIANAKSELKRILKYLKLLDQVEEKYIAKVMDEAGDYPITLMHEILGFITTSIDRSNAIITSIIKANPEMPQGVQLVVGNNSTVTINNTSIDEVNAKVTGNATELNSAQRERIRNYVQSVINNMTAVEKKITDPTEFVETKEEESDEGTDVE